MPDNELDVLNRTHHEAQSHMELLPNYYAWTYRRFINYIKGEVIELGCGGGFGIKTYIGRVQHVYAVDHNAELLERVASRFQDGNVTPILADLRGDWRELDGLSVDTAILMDVLEHFSNDGTVLRNVARCLKPGGVAIIKVPAQSNLYSEMDKASGHYRRYDASSLSKLAAANGLEPLRVCHMNLVGGLIYRLKNKQSVNFSKTFSSTELRVINLLLPIAELFDWIPRLPGLSLIGAFQKRISDE